jgi:hypothetical protein
MTWQDSRVLATRLVGLCLILLVAGSSVGCFSGGTELTVRVDNQATEPVVLWLYKTGPDVENHLMSPGTLLATLPVTENDDRPSGPPAIELPGQSSIVLGPVRGRFGRGSSPILGIFGTARTLNELAAEPKRSSTVARVELGPGENLVVVESAVPTRTLRQPVDRLEGR